MSTNTIAVNTARGSVNDLPPPWGRRPAGGINSSANAHNSSGTNRCDNPSTTSIPKHVAMVMDGNRRWTREAGLTDVSKGHRRGLTHVTEVLSWCAGLGIDNLASGKRVLARIASTSSVQGRPPATTRTSVHRKPS